MSVGRGRSRPAETIGTASYLERLAQEGAFWGREAEAQAAVVPPDWRFHRDLLHNVAGHAAEVDAFLTCIQPGMRTLELGCGSGWLTLAMAQRGALATGMDISEAALEQARRYSASLAHSVTGSASYEAGDLNRIDLGAGSFDIVAIKGTLHHLIAPEHVIAQVEGALKPHGLLWVSDTFGEEAPAAVLVAAVLTFLLPTHVRYHEKVRSLMRFRWRSLERVRASMQAEGLTPFEGAGRGREPSDWLALIRARFAVEVSRPLPAFTGYVAHQIEMPPTLARAVVSALRVADLALVRGRAVRSTGLVVWARKRQADAAAG